MTHKASFLLALLLFRETDKATQKEDKEKAIKRNRQSDTEGRQRESDKATDKATLELISLR
jgi:hypothetical protein